MIEALYFTEKFKEWTNSVKPGTFEDLSHDEPRIIIPFKDKEGNTFGYQGRSLSNSGLRYITILLQDDKPKIFGLNTLDYEQRIYITEGPLDSLFIKNCWLMLVPIYLVSATLGVMLFTYLTMSLETNRSSTEWVNSSIEDNL